MSEMWKENLSTVVFISASVKFSAIAWLDWMFGTILKFSQLVTFLDTSLSHTLIIHRFQNAIVIAQRN